MSTYRIHFSNGTSATTTIESTIQSDEDIAADVRKIHEGRERAGFGPTIRFIDWIVNGRPYTVFVAEDLRPTVITA